LPRRAIDLVDAVVASLRFVGQPLDELVVDGLG
jgi:hypothetical protein